MARSRRRRSTGRNVAVGIIVVGLVVGVYLKWVRGPGERPAPAPGERLAATAPETNDRRPDAVEPRLAERGDKSAGPVSEVESTRPVARGDWRTLLQAGRTALASGDRIGARVKLSAALRAGLPKAEAGEVYRDLQQVAQETVFSSRVERDDPLAEMYMIRPGDTLAKIAKQYAVTDDLLARVNGIKNKHRIRAGQRIKVIKGPFHVEVCKSGFSLNIHLQDVIIAQFPVGIGADDGTPTGEWRVSKKLTNPTYYPPRGGKIIPSDDASNPLGERWIGLEGVSGEAAGQERYGIHGTIDPDSVGRAVSMGCIRMRNADVEALYDMVVSGQSRVVIRE